jgi:response regulator RpfG family c-di-GMP phosphodiesterase
MDYRLLLVDDDRNLLNSFQRLLIRRLKVDTAESGAQGLEKVKKNGPYAMVISDYKMPGMNGVEFLTEVGKIEPDTVRILLTAHANLDVALDAVNKGQIFRLLTKPCSKPVLGEVIKAGFRQYQLTKSEKELLEKTVAGSMKLLGDLMNMLKADAYERVGRIQPLIKTLAEKLGDESLWATESAAVLSQLGYALLPDEIREKVEAEEPLNVNEQRLFDQYPVISEKLIANIPRLEPVAQIARYVEKRFDGSGPPDDDVGAGDIPLGARVIKTLFDFDRNSMQSKGQETPSDSEMLAMAQKMAGHRHYDPKVVEALVGALEKELPYKVHSVPLSELQVNMILAEDLYLERKGKKTKFMAKGHEINAMGLEYMQNYASYLNLERTIKVLEIT